MTDASSISQAAAVPLRPIWGSMGSQAPLQPYPEALMKGFLKHWARLNAPFLVKVLRKVAEDLEHLVAGSPMMATPPIFTTEGETTMGMISVEDGAAPLSATVVFLDAEGNETTADDVPQWSSDNDAVASVESSEDGMSGTVTIVSPGAAIISVDTTNDDGTTVHSQGTVTVLPGNAVTGDVEFQAPEAGAGDEPQVNPL